MAQHCPICLLFGIFFLKKQAHCQKCNFWFAKVILAGLIIAEVNTVCVSLMISIWLSGQNLTRIMLSKSTCMSSKFTVSQHPLIHVFLLFFHLPLIMQKSTSIYFFICCLCMYFICFHSIQVSITVFGCSTCFIMLLIALQLIVVSESEVNSWVKVLILQPKKVVHCCQCINQC